MKIEILIFARCLFGFCTTKAQNLETKKKVGLMKEEEVEQVEKFFDPLGVEGNSSFIVAAV